MEWIQWIGVRAGVAYLAWAALLFLLQRKMIYPRYFTQPLQSAGRGIPDLVVHWHESPEGRVESWFLPGQGASASRPGPAVIFAHGNGELIEHWPAMLEPYRKLGISVYLPEYRGYGRSAGSPSEKAIVEDFLAFREWLAARPEVDPKRIVYHGRSLGGGALCALALQRPPAALILQSTFTSLAEMAKGYLVPSFLLLDTFDNAGALARLDCPALLFHGRRDGVIPFSHSERLEQAAKRAERIAYDCDHNDFPPDWDRFFDDVERFLRRSGILPAR